MALLMARLKLIREEREALRLFAGILCCLTAVEVDYLELIHNDGCSLSQINC